jgi:signal transduction histidine kinase
VQNNWSNSVYVNQQRAVPQAKLQQALPPEARLQVPLPQVTPAPAAPSQVAPSPQAPITITVSPLEWRTLGFAGQPAVVAVRQVETPDGRLAQGFVVDRTALTSWLATHAGDAVAELRTGDSTATEIVPGWHLEVAANPRALVAAASEATAVARGFVLRFALIGVVAILAACLVVMLVAHAERLARERSQFAAAAAHELRTPLAGLQLYGDMLADGLGDPSKMRDYARRMSEEASRLGRVVSNVLGFSQLERGNLSVEPRAGALGDALCELAERAQPALDRAGAVLALDVAPELSATFDRDALARIVGNLLDNAEKYGRQSDDRTITLAARATGTAVEVVVSDHGPGIASPARARLFQPFARGVTADGPAGLGLGLALSQSLARAMGGELAYRPGPDGGAAFVLTLARG